MRRFPALLLLLVIATFLGLAAWDECELAGEDCPPACHLACVDGCGVVTPPEAATWPSTMVALEPVAADLPHRSSLAPPRPEISPPRAA